ncbi:MAG: hypothetical protein Q9186_005490 [Xanthomendoza sp. 1 TL-2023]
MQPSHFRQPSLSPRHQDQHSFSNTTSPSSALLQDLLREKKSSHRVSRISEREDSNMNESQVQSSPIGPSAASKPQSRRISGSTVPKGMGLREMEEYISKISKQNFDLKLEIFQRRQRTEALEGKAARADQLETENEELQQINDDLIQELEKRDAAVGEAVSLICELEAKVEELERQGQDNARPTTPTRSNVPAPEGSRSLDPPIFPPHSPGSLKSSGESFSAREDRIRTPDQGPLHEPRGDNRLLQSPSFLHDDKPSTSALRGLFRGHDNGPNGLGFGSTKTSSLSLRGLHSPFSQDDADTLDADNLSLNLRRLSLLSDGSFVSIYGQNTEIIPSSNVNSASSPKDNPDSDGFTRKLSPEEGRIRHWIESRDPPASGSKRPLKSARADAFSSIGEIIGPNQPDPRDNPSSSSSPTPTRALQRQQQSQRLGRTDIKASLAGPFGPDAFPPTPGTMSTATLGGRSSNYSINAGKSPVNGTSRPTTSDASNIPYPRSYGTHGGLRSLQDNGAENALQSTFGNDTDIEVPDDKQHPAYRNTHNDQGNYLDNQPRLTSLMAEPVRADHVTQSHRSQRLRLSSYGTEKVFNGAGTATSPPFRTISDEPKAKPTAFIIDTFKAIAGHKPSAHSNLHGSPLSKKPIFRTAYINPSRNHTTEVKTPSAQANEPIYAYDIQSTTVTRSSIDGSSSLSSSGLFASHVDNDGYIAASDGVHESEQQQLPPPQSKRLSVGALGRSASLRIKEGFGRKK